MICPDCNGKTKVINTRGSTVQYRLRRCVKCGKLFYTTEIVTDSATTNAKLNEAFREQMERRNV